MGFFFQALLCPSDLMHHPTHTYYYSLVLVIKCGGGVCFTVSSSYMTSCQCVVTLITEFHTDLFKVNTRFLILIICY